MLILPKCTFDFLDIRFLRMLDLALQLILSVLARASIRAFAATAIYIPSLWQLAKMQLRTYMWSIFLLYRDIAPAPVVVRGESNRDSPESYPIPSQIRLLSRRLFFARRFRRCVLSRIPGIFSSDAFDA